MRGVTERLSCSVSPFSAEVKQGHFLPSCFQLSCYKQVLFCGLFMFWGFHFLIFKILLFKNLPNVVLSSVPKHRRLRCAPKKIPLLVKLSSVTSHSAVGYELSVNGATVYILRCLFIFKISFFPFFPSIFIYLFIFGCVGSSFLCEGFQIGRASCRERV